MKSLKTQPFPLFRSSVAAFAGAALLLAGPAVAQVKGSAYTDEYEELDGAQSSKSSSSDKKYKSKYDYEQSVDRSDDRYDSNRSYRSRNNRNRDDRYRDGRYTETKIIRCRSRKGQYRSCAFDVSNVERVSIHRVLENRDCRRANWGHNRNGIWVDRGCKAEFRVTYRTRYDNRGNGRDRDYRDRDYRDRDYRDRDRGYSRISQRQAINNCYARAERELRGRGFDRVSLIRVKDVDRERDYYDVKLRVEVRNRYSREKCTIRCSANSRYTRVKID